MRSLVPLASMLFALAAGCRPRRSAKGDVAGGGADIAAAQAIKPDVADWHAKWGAGAP